jgi:branched-chain amino acid transport system ATP-binding protein
MGLLPLQRGGITLDEADLAGVAPHRRSRLGIGFMPEDRRLIPDLSVEENVLLPAWAARLADAEAQDRLVWTYTRMPEVQQFADRKASLLSGGQQKLVALARSLMIGRRLLLLDEPFEGVAPALAQRLIEVIAGLKGEGATVLISESDYTHSRELVDQVFVIERGVVTPQ